MPRPCSAPHGDAKLMAGGQTFIPTLKQRLAQPSDVIDLGAIAELKGIKEEAGGLTIGAMTKHAEVAASDVVKRVIPSLAALAELIGDPQVRNRGTLGGSISNNDPAADYPGALLALGATVRTNKRELVGRRLLHRHVRDRPGARTRSSPRCISPSR